MSKPPVNLLVERTVYVRLTGGWFRKSFDGRHLPRVWRADFTVELRENSVIRRRND